MAMGRDREMVVLFSIVVICGYAVPWQWTGFSDQRLWDWIKDLLVPFALPVALIVLGTRALESGGRPAAPAAAEPKDAGPRIGAECAPGVPAGPGAKRPGAPDCGSTTARA